MFELQKIIDLTHTLNDAVPTWEGSCGFQSLVKLDYSDCSGPLPFRVQEIKCLAGIGTHMDAPCHCFAQGKDISQLAIEELMAPFIKLDIEAKAHETYALSQEDIFEFEKEHGLVEKGSIAVVHTGWQKYWKEPQKYRNHYKFPYVSEAAATLLLERGVMGLAIDTLSPDAGTSHFRVHRLFLGAGKYIIENIVQSGQLPPKGRWMIALPIKGEGLSEAPIRLIACLT